MRKFSMPRDARCITNGEESYKNSLRKESKRNHQWFLEDTGLDLFSNKKPALEDVRRPVLGMSSMNVSPSDENFSFQSVSTQLNSSGNHVDRNILSTRSGNMNTVRNDHSMGLSMSRTNEGPSSCLNIGGVRKRQMNGIPISIGDSYCQIDRYTNTMSTNYSTSESNTISLGPKFHENTISRGHAFSKADEKFMSMGHKFNKGYGSFISMGHNYDKQESILSTDQAFNKGDDSVISLGSSYDKGYEKFFSMTPAYRIIYENFEKFGSKDPSFSKGNDNIIRMATVNKVNNNVGGLNEDSNTIRSGGITNSHDMLTSNQNAAKLPQVPYQKDSFQPNALSVVNDPPKENSKSERVPKKREPKEPKRVVLNNFPSNVKSLLSTGMFDGITVKYSSWCRKNSIRGTIKGTGYMCGCKDCKYKKCLNSYEFENHAGCKTKHPNDNIYFASGKTIYAVVQELKNTLPEMLFDAIQKITGSAINQNNFQTWKASYIAANSELQRIYGKDEVVTPSEK